MRILLTVLKITGLGLAGIAAVFVLLCAVLLFAPVRYELCAVKAALSEKAAVNFRLSWLFGFLRVGYDGKRLLMTVFWFYRIGKKRRVRKSGNVKKETKERDISVPIWRKVKGIFSTPNRKLIWKHAKTLIKRILRALKPRKLSLTAEIGLSDPSYTGWLLGFLGIISGVWKLPLNITGNFAESCLAYNVHMKDAFIPWSFTWPFVAFCAKKPVRELIFNILFKKDDGNEPNTNTELRVAAQ